MDENNVDVTVTDPVTGPDVSESLSADTESVTDVVGTDTDSGGGDSGSVDGEGVEEGVTLDGLVDEETGSIPVYIINESPPAESLYNEELGGVPVVITDDVSALASYIGDGGTSYQMSTYYVDYFAGVLANMHDTDYVAFSARIYSGSSSYVEHNYLVYDIAVDGDSASVGVYPCIDIYRSSSNASYTVSRTTYNLSSVPAFSYASFAPYSDLREGVSHDVSWAFLFFAGFTVVYNVCHDIFDYVMSLRRS